jgi:hypothetical protein
MGRDFFVAARSLLRMCHATGNLLTSRVSQAASKTQRVKCSGASLENAPLGANIAQGIDIFWD